MKAGDVMPLDGFNVPWVPLAKLTAVAHDLEAKAAYCERQSHWRGTAALLRAAKFRARAAVIRKMAGGSK